MYFVLTELILRIVQPYKNILCCNPVIKILCFFSVSANKTLRELQDEIVDLRMREAQNLKDLHKLNKENSQLKLKVIYFIFHTSFL